MELKLEFSVHAGDWYNRGVKAEEFLPTQVRNVTNILVHENFSASTLHNNIALLRLSSPMEYDANVAPVCLPDWNVNYDSEGCVVTGWGTDAQGECCCFHVYFTLYS